MDEDKWDEDKCECGGTYKRWFGFNRSIIACDECKKEKEKNGIKGTEKTN